jgi:hypothetical protein
MQRKLEITIQTDRRLVIYGTGLSRAWCQQCDAETGALTLEAAGLVAESISAGLWDRLLGADLHRTQCLDGSVRICVRSLLQTLHRENEAGGPSSIKGLLPEE